MINLKHLAAIAAVASLSTVFAQTAPARTNSPPPAPGQQARPIQRFDRSLQGLTEDQRKKIEEANKAYAATATPLSTRLGTTRRELEVLVTADKLDEAAMRAKAKEMADIEADLAVARAQRYAKFRSFLTPDQAKRLSQPTPLARPFQPALHDGPTPPAGATNK